MIYNNSGGAEGDRTPDLVIANDALSQLSYGPDERAFMGSPGVLSSGIPAAGHPALAAGRANGYMKRATRPFGPRHGQVPCNPS